MIRIIVIALLGQFYFFILLPMVMSFRMTSIENYNLFYLPFLVALFFFLLHRTCVVEKQGLSVRFFGGMVLW